MGNLAGLAIQYSRVTIFLTLALVVAGVASFLNMPSQEDPEITIRHAQVTAYFPGMASERVEQLLTVPLEEVIKQIPEVERITSSSQTGSTTINVKVYDRYVDLQPIWQELRTKLEDYARQLPDGTLGPVVNDDYGRVSVATLALSGPEFTAPELRIVSRHLRDQLASIVPLARAAAGVDQHGP